MIEPNISITRRNSMNRKILTLFLLLIALSTIAIVSAADTQKIGDVEFNVPEGYTYDADSVNVFLQAFEDEPLGDVGVFKNNDDEILAIMVYNETPQEQDYPDDYKFKNKTINNKTGTLGSASSRINIVFMYNEGDKYVLIQAMNEDVLKETIK